MNINNSKLLFTVELGKDSNEDFYNTHSVTRDLTGQGIAVQNIKRICKTVALNYILIDKSHEDALKAILERYDQSEYLELDSNRGLHSMSILAPAW